MATEYDFAGNDFHVAPGDVLLLRSSGKGFGNVAGQWLKRGRKVRYTHVAIVVDANTIADAVPGVGVSFRRWRDIERQYDIPRSRIARHVGLASDPKGREQVHRSALFFVKQPYKLVTAIRDPGSIHEQSGLVCSHFVAAFMRRLGLRVSRRRETATLPVDIDTYSRSASEWRQFGLEKSGLFSGAPRPKADDPYWAALQVAALSQLSEWDRADPEPSRPVPDIREIPATLDGAVNWLSKSDETLRRSQALSELIEDKFHETTELQYTASRKSAALEKLLLEVSEGLVAGSGEAHRASMALLRSEGPLGGELQPVTGTLLFQQWDALYRKPLTPAVFMHQEDAAATRDRHRALLRQSVQRARELAANQFLLFDEVSRTVERLVTAASQGPVAPEAAALVADVAEKLHRSAWFLRGEDVQVVRERTDRLDERLRSVLAWARQCGLEKPAIERAHETFTEICRYDVDVVHWRSMETALLSFIDALRH